jgi:nitrogen PTS system EIIA component
MGSDMMDVEELAAYLRRDVREVGKLASRGHLPGHKVGGEWRFARAEINRWLEKQLPEYDDQQLAALERTTNRGGEAEPLLASLLSEASVAVPLGASTKASALKALLNLAEQSWNVYDSPALLEAIRGREEMSSTALPGGVAIPHPHRPLPAALGESVLAYGRTLSGIPFGAPQGELTDLFFLVCCRDDRTHLRVLARLTRLILRPGFLDSLRETDTAAESYEKITQAEMELLR